MTAAARISPAHVMEQAAVIIFGRDGAKARASWFAGEDRKRATNAAKLMGMNALKVANDDVRRLATKMPRGRLFESGKAFVPLVQGAVCDQLLTYLPKGGKLKVHAIAGAANSKGEEAVSGKAANAVVPVHYPTGWGDIKVGSLVLATEGEGEGWFECIVTEAYSKELRLKWRDYPEYEVFTRGYDGVALLWAAPTQAASN